MKLSIPWLMVSLFLTVVRPDTVFAQPNPADIWQEKLFSALKRENLIDPDRQLLQIQYVCSLTVARHVWYVIDTFEITHNAGETSPKGISTILVLDQQLRPVRKMDRPPQARPLFCIDNTLFLDSDEFDAENGEDPGNTIAFLQDRSVHVSIHDRASLPVPLTVDRRHYRLP